MKQEMMVVENYFNENAVNMCTYWKIPYSKHRELKALCTANNIIVQKGIYDGFYKLLVNTGKSVKCLLVFKYDKQYTKQKGDEYRIVIETYGWKAGTHEIDERGNLVFEINGINTYKRLKEEVKFQKQVSRNAKRGKIKSLRIYSNNYAVAKSLWIE